MAELLDVDPRTLRLPETRLDGADPTKFARQLSRFGKSSQGMPPIFVLRGANGELMILDGVTRATRIAKFVPGQAVRVEVIDEDPGRDVSSYPTVADKLP